MRQYDLSPLYRSTVGFDRLFTMLDQASVSEGVAGYPPYNIERTGELNYRITVAVAGFAEQELSIESKENTLTIRGSKETEATDANPDTARREVLHRGIAARAFERRFQLADHVQVVGAALEHGLLHVDLVREIPEAQKPRRIAIGKPAPAVVETQRAA
jgi:molecular chaperone IbpA